MYECIQAWKVNADVVVLYTKTLFMISASCYCLGQNTGTSIYKNVVRKRLGHISLVLQ